MYHKYYYLSLLLTFLFYLSCSEGPTSSGATEVLSDIDGNTYEIVKIGDQWWMAENLKVTRYRNGETIPNITSDTAWSNLNTGAMCSLYNLEINVATFGRLYNWYAIVDSQNIAPEGWHIPTDEEWKELEMHLGMSQDEADRELYRGTDEGGLMKATGTELWDSPNAGATNESGFSALPSGYRHPNGIFYDKYRITGFWSSSETSNNYAYYRTLKYNSSIIFRENYYKKYGFSIRCVKD